MDVDATRAAPGAATPAPRTGGRRTRSDRSPPGAAAAAGRRAREAEADAVERVGVLEHPEDAEGAFGPCQAARRVFGRGELGRVRRGASVRQRVPGDGEADQRGVVRREAGGEPELVGAHGAASAVRRFHAVGLAADVVPESGAKDEPRIRLVPAQPLEQALRVHVYAPRVALAVKPRRAPEPPRRYVRRASDPRPHALDLGSRHEGSIAPRPDGTGGGASPTQSHSTCFMNASSHVEQRNFSLGRSSW